MCIICLINITRCENVPVDNYTQSSRKATYAFQNQEKFDFTVIFLKQAHTDCIIN